MLRRFSLLTLGCALWLGSSSARAAVVDPEFVETTFTKIKALTSMAWAPDASNRLFVLQKTGEILIVEDGQLLAQPFATITPVFIESECGLLGIAFDPDFVSNGYVYLFVSVSSTEQQIRRLTAQGNQGTDEALVLGGLPTQGKNHDGGALGFGPDGKLYWAIGDNGSPRQGADADLLSLAAKVGRANRDGSAPGDNPFFDAEGPNNDYIWARGFRNPFSLTFEPSTGQLWLNVVGNRHEQVFTPQAGDHGGWDNYEANQPAGFLSPVIAYDTNGNAPRPITATGAVRASGMVTITTTAAHFMRPGGDVTIAGVTDGSFDGPAVIQSADVLSFSFAQTGPDDQSGGGTATPAAIGGALTGGEFWDSSAVPVAYRGNFFFGDYNSDSVFRVQLDNSQQVTSITPFTTGLVRLVDMALGPDGDMYYGGHTGSIYRARYSSAAQGIVVSRLHVRMAEGGKAAFGVRLATAPASNRTVLAQHFSGDTDVAVMEGETLTFTPTNWATPQRVVLSAAQDLDSLEDAAQVRVTSSGLAAVNVSVKVTDDETFSVAVSPSSLDVDEGSSEQVEVWLTQPPPGTLEVSAARSAGDASLSVTAGAALTFDAGNWDTPQLVTVTAAEDADALSGTATLTLSGQGLTSRDVAINVLDNEDHAPTFTSSAVTTAVVGAPYEYDVEADALPDPVFSLDSAPQGMTIDPASGLIEWTALAEGVEPVTVRAENGVLPDALQSFEIVVSADAPPACALTKPGDGDVVAGTDAEFFGDVIDDVGPVRAEFLIDGQVAYEDQNPDGHYHFGGSHNLFDTTQLEDGEHTVAIRGYDTAGQSCLAEAVITVDNGSAGGGGAGAGGADGSTPGAGGGVSPSEAGSPGFEPSDGGALGQGGMPTSEAGSASDVAGPGADDDSGCGCRVGSERKTSVGFVALVALLGLLRRRRNARP